MILIGLMSGTSLDGVDAVAVRFDEAGRPERLGRAYAPFDAALRGELLGLAAGTLTEEIEHLGRAAVSLTRVYAQAVEALLAETGLARSAVRALGAHGQTIRHRPEAGFTMQILEPALLAELCGIDVVFDFRARDVAAGGEGAPLVPAFHAEVFRRPEPAAILNVGGIANATLLPAAGCDAPVLGFDTGPGNMLLDLWTQRVWSEPFDRDGRRAAAGRVDDKLLARLLAAPYFRLSPPKSTGRELFSEAFLDAALAGFEALSPEDIAATITMCTAKSAVEAVCAAQPATRELYLCGGGALNPTLMRMVRACAPDLFVADTSVLGIDPMEVEASAFAWLARAFLLGIPGNCPAVTGARAARVLGCLYPA